MLILSVISPNVLLKPMSFCCYLWTCRVAYFLHSRQEDRNATLPEEYLEQNCFLKTAALLICLGLCLVALTLKYLICERWCTLMSVFIVSVFSICSKLEKKWMKLGSWQNLMRKDMNTSSISISYLSVANFKKHEIVVTL